MPITPSPAEEGGADDFERIHEEVEAALDAVMADVARELNARDASPVSSGTDESVAAKRLALAAYDATVAARHAEEAGGWEVIAARNEKNAAYLANLNGIAEQNDEECAQSVLDIATFATIWLRDALAALRTAQARVEELEGECESLTRDLEATREHLVNAESDHSAANSAVAELEYVNTDLRAALAVSQARVEALTRERDEALGCLREQQDEMLKAAGEVAVSQDREREAREALAPFARFAAVCAARGEVLYHAESATHGEAHLRLSDCQRAAAFVARPSSLEGSSDA